MNKPRSCGCKGSRSCLLCEKVYNIKSDLPGNLDKNRSYVYCPYCDKAWPGWDVNLITKAHPNHQGEPLPYPGIYIKLDFLSEAEEIHLIKNLDSLPWDLSQSGRRKQNFGPKCNFKKRKLRLGNFNGFPRSTQFVQEKFRAEPSLHDFQTIEQCSLEYDPCRGASIDPHVDDCWIWGERIVTVNLLSDSVLTMTYNSKPDRYNLDCVQTYNVEKPEMGKTYPVVRIPMPRKSLLVIKGAARYDWEHQVLREDVCTRRVCLAYREFTPPYLEGGEKYQEVVDVFLNAQKFWE